MQLECLECQLLSRQQPNINQTLGVTCDQARSINTQGQSCDLFLVGESFLLAGLFDWHLVYVQVITGEVNESFG
jgi:hypothetical protein